MAHFFHSAHSPQSPSWRPGWSAGQLSRLVRRPPLLYVNVARLDCLLTARSYRRLELKPQQMQQCPVPCHRGSDGTNVCSHYSLAHRTSPTQVLAVAVGSAIEPQLGNTTQVHPPFLHQTNARPSALGTVGTTAPAGGACMRPPLLAEPNTRNRTDHIHSAQKRAQSEGGSSPYQDGTPSHYIQYQPFGHRPLQILHSLL